MRIKIRELKQQLNTEIQLMDRKSSECRQWLSRFSVFDLQSYELQGEAYTALTSRIHSHSEFLRSQSLLFDAVKKGDRKNLAALGELRPTEPDGSVDTGHLEQLISDMQSRTSHLEDMCGRARSLLNSAEGNAAADSLAEATEHLNAVCEAAARGYRDALERVHRYINISSTFYADVQNLIPVISQASAAARAIAEGRDADMAWAEAVDNQWGVAVQSEMKKYMTGEEWEAYKKAVADGWQASDFYRAGKGEKDPAKNNKALWKGLAKLPSWLLTSGMASAAVKAMENMANGKYTKFNPDVKSLQEAVRFLFARDGSKRSSFANVRLYGYKKSALLDWVTGASNSFTRNTLMVSTDKGDPHAPWVGRAMVNNILNLIKNIKPVWVRLDTGEITKSIWGITPVGLGINLSIMLPPQKSTSSARMVIIGVEPHLSHVITAESKPDGTTASLSHMYVAMSGGMGDLINFAHNLQNIKGLAGWDVVGASGHAAFNKGFGEVKSFIAKQLPKLVGKTVEAFTILQDFASDVMDEEQNRKRADKVNKLNDAQLFYDRKEIFNDMGVIFRYKGIHGEHDENYVDPIAQMLSKPEVQTKIKHAIEMYNRLHPGKRYRFSEFTQDIKKNLLDIPEASDKSKLVRTKDFIDWTGRYANLVYRRDVVDSDGVVHHKGDKVVLGNPPSNFGYIKGADMEYKDYMFASGQGE
ncbi:hypothetical protein ACFQ1H_03020 [Scardovia wiggsiae]|uniref:hypothetical protein n=2 Tax=Scardovia wiggsiae TaxID=230143 RepID=UPI003624F22E